MPFLLRWPLPQLVELSIHEIYSIGWIANYSINAVFLHLGHCRHTIGNANFPITGTILVHFALVGSGASLGAPQLQHLFSRIRVYEWQYSHSQAP
jgi:hypothetical protein